MCFDQSLNKYALFNQRFIFKIPDTKNQLVKWNRGKLLRYGLTHFNLNP